MTSNIRVWCNFTVNNKGSDLKLRLQDAPKERLDDVVELYAKYFGPEEAFHRVSGISKNENSLEEYKGLISVIMKDCSVVICCLDDEPDKVGQIIGASFMVITEKDEPHMELDLKTNEMKKIFGFTTKGLEMFNVMKELNLDKFYDDKGIVVHSDYRGFGIAQKLFHIRRVICSAEGIPITGAWVSMIGSQKAAERDGWETVWEMSYDEIGKLFEVTFEDVPPTCKYMVAKAI